MQMTGRRPRIAGDTGLHSDLFAGFAKQLTTFAVT